MIEIERKFLVLSTKYRELSFKNTRIIQGFLSTDPKRTIRVRLKNNKGELTIKGMSSNDGLSRFEWETEISSKDAMALLKLCELELVVKKRFEVKFGTHTFEIDEFEGDNSGLVIAEVELTHENEHFEKPDWLGDEV
ncbi:MAG: CYTH domain-containing protein, partial [Flavobacteriaceae bacterium]|nr:CYTH domain-containing protein [Flavobacteriaceae bacterium]